MNKLIRGVLLAMSIVAGLAAERVALGGTFSVDFQGPTAGLPALAPWLPPGTPIDEGQILTTAVPGPLGPNPPVLGPPALPPPGIMVDSAPASPIGSVPGGLGIVPGAGGFVELDALSYGHDHPPLQHQQGGGVVFFSVDEFAVGIPFSPAPPNVWSEGPFGPVGPPAESAADVFTYLGPFVPMAPPAFVFGNTGVFDGNGLLSASLAVYPGVGLIEPNPPTPGALPDPGDNLDAVDVDTTLADVMGPIYISLDSAFPDPLEGPGANTGTAVANGFVGGDVLVTSAGGLPALYAPAPVLGLDLVPGAGPDSDDLDALALWENGDGEFIPGMDLIFYSVRRGSAVIGALDSAWLAPIEEGDILVPPGFLGALSPFPGIFIPAEALGLWTFRSFGATEFGPFGDDLDALDVVPEPSTVSLLVLGSLCLLGYAWRRRCRPAA